MKTSLYYHIYLTDDISSWSNIVFEQFRELENAKLLNHLDELNITCVSKRDMRVPIFLEIIKSYKSNYKLDYVESPFNSDSEMFQNINDNRFIENDDHTENFTLKKIYNDSLENDMKVFYLHAKGITSAIKNLYSGNIEMHKKYFYWRQFLSWGTIENWEKCWKALDEFDTAGVSFYNIPAPHYSGNIWWSKSSHIKTLPDPETREWWNILQKETTNGWLKTAPDRFRFEQWLCSNANTKTFNLFSFPENENPAFNLKVKSEYKDKLL